MTRPGYNRKFKMVLEYNLTVEIGLVINGEPI